MGRALAPLFDLLTLPGVVAASVLRWGVATVALPPVEDLEGGAEIPYRGIVLYVAVPFAVLTAGAVAAFAASAALAAGGSRLGEPVLVWVGLSLSVHAFPGEGATAALFSHSLESDSRWRWIGAPLAAVAGPMAELRAVWLDLVYGLALLSVVRLLLAGI